MKTALSFGTMVTLLGLSLTACSLQPDAEGGGADQQGSKVLSESEFSFGAWSSGDQGPPDNADFLEVTDWVLADGVGGAQEAGLNAAKSKGKPAYIYFYIAAGLAKKAYGIDDCNVTDFDHSLCKWGGDYISKHTAEVLAGHAAAAQRVQQIMGSTPTLVHVEPDWYQYTETMPYGKPAVHPLGPDESGSILNKIVETIHSNCSSCKVVLDVSPWAGDLRAYFSSVNMGAVQFVGLVGKSFPATTGKIDNYTYGDISSITGRKIIANTSHGPGGGAMDYDASWDSVDSINAMKSLGVAGLIQSNRDPSRYASAISRYKSAQGGGNSSTSGGGTDNGGGTGSGGGSTDFSFSVPSTINAWWIQVHVNAPPGHNVTSVTANVNGASYPLELKSWGDWATSPSSPVPGGATVVFTAKDERGDEGKFSSQPWPGN